MLKHTTIIQLNNSALNNLYEDDEDMLCLRRKKEKERLGVLHVLWIILALEYVTIE